jgi:predicted permease
MLTDRLRDLRKGFRQVLQRPGFSLAAIASLALGIGANTVLFGLVNALMLGPIPGVAESERLVEVGRGSNGAAFDTLGAPDIADIAAAVPALERVFGYEVAPLNVRAGGEPRRALGFVVSESYFETFGVSAALGRVFLAQDAGRLHATPGVVISDVAWRAHFNADPHVSDRRVTINGADFAILGVAPPSFRGHLAMLQPEFFVPLSLSPLINADARDMLGSRNARWLLAGGRLAPGATTEQAAAQLAALAAHLAEKYPDTHERVSLSVARLSALPGGAREAVTLFAGAMFALVGLILVLACVNVAGMLLARGEARSAEFALRAAIGASRFRLVHQLFAEGLVLAALAGAGGLLLALLGRRLIELIRVPAPFPVELSLPFDGTVLAFTALISLVTALLFAVWPALRVSQRAPRAALAAGGATDTTRSTRSRDLLVVVQFAVSLVLLVAAGLFMRSLQRAAEIDPGFRSENVSYAEFDLQPSGYAEDRAQALATSLLARVRALPGVESATLTGVLPLSLNRMGMGAARTQAAPDRLLEPDTNTIGTDFFGTLDIALRGRDFTDADKAGGEDVAIVNQAFAEQLFGRSDAIGQSFELGFGESWRRLRVVGVAADGKYASLSEERTPFLFLPHAQWPRLSLHVLVKSGATPAVLERALRNELARLDPNLPLPTVHALDEVTALSVLPQRIAGSRQHRGAGRHAAGGYRSVRAHGLLRDAASARDRRAAGAGRFAADHPQRHRGTRGPARRHRARSRRGAGGHRLAGALEPAAGHRRDRCLGLPGSAGRTERDGCARDSRPGVAGGIGAAVASAALRVAQGGAAAAEACRPPRPQRCRGSGVSVSPLVLCRHAQHVSRSPPVAAANAVAAVTAARVRRPGAGRAR